MTPTIQQLEAFAAARDFEPLPDAPTRELDDVLDAFGAAMQPLSGTLLLKGFVDNTPMAYFFESL